MKRLASLLFCAGALCLAGAPASRADFTENLLARWTFNRSGAPGLLDDMGSIALQAATSPGAPATAPKFNPDGSVSLASSQALFADGLNSTRFPALGKGVTIWSRLRIDSEKAEHTSFLFGLLKDNRGADWADAVLVFLQALPSTGGGLGVFAHLSDRAEMSIGKNTVPEKPGVFVNVAIVFDGQKQELTAVVDGEIHSVKRAQANVLDAFGTLALGQAKRTGGAAVTFDELRVYSVPLTPEWIAEISAVPAAAPVAGRK